MIDRSVMVEERVRKRDQKSKNLQAGDLEFLVKVPAVARSIWDLVDGLMKKNVHVMNLVKSGGSCLNAPNSCG